MESIFPKYADQLSGTWNLVSYAVYMDRNEDTIAFKPHGDSPSGKIILTPSGYVSAILLPPDKKTLVPEDDLRKVADDELLGIARSLAAYCGPVHLYHDGDDLIWTCNVEIANNPNWVGKPQTRAVQLLSPGLNGKPSMVLRPRKDYILPVQYPSLQSRSTMLMVVSRTAAKVTLCFTGKRWMVTPT